MKKKYYCPVCGYESDEPIELGQFYMVKINKIKGYDLFGTKISTKE